MKKQGLLKASSKEVRQPKQSAWGLLILGMIMILAMPFILTREGFVDFTKTGQIGDTIGGITAPLASFLGSILVFYAFREQVKANELIQRQHDDAKSEEANRKRVNFLIQELNNLERDFDKFESTKNHGSTILRERGAYALGIVLRKISDREKQKIELSREEHAKKLEVENLLKSFNTFASYFKQIEIESILDREFLNRRLQHIYESRINLPFISVDNNTQTIIELKKLVKNPSPKFIFENNSSHD